MDLMTDLAMDSSGIGYSRARWLIEQASRSRDVFCLVWTCRQLNHYGGLSRAQRGRLRRHFKRVRQDRAEIDRLRQEVRECVGWAGCMSWSDDSDGERLHWVISRDLSLAGAVSEVCRSEVEAWRSAYGRAIGREYAARRLIGNG